VGKPERERDHWNDLGVDGRIIIIIIIIWVLNNSLLYKVVQI
jgi:hypothetical protein